MTLTDRLVRLVWLFLVLLTPFQVARSQVTVPTERYDNSRTGANLGETVLNAGNVNVSQFGKLWSYAVSGSVQAQPLYVPGLNIPGKGTANVLYVVTMNDVVYAFDADHVATVWTLDLTNPAAGVTPVPIVDIVNSNSLNIVGNVGIESTPVIDLNTNTMYLVARTKENGSYFQRLHALDLLTGAERTGSPVTISGSVTGTAGTSGVLTFDPKIEQQRASLALAGGQVIIAWSSHEDINPYHGWIMAYDAKTLARSGIFCVSPDGVQAGVWQAGRAPVVDATGNVYFQTGNGDWNGARNFGQSFLKFSSSGNTLALADWFTPDNWSSLNPTDLDIGSSGPMMVPGTNLIIGGGKQSIFYLLDSTNLGHQTVGNTQIPQLLTNSGGEIKGGPVYWNRTGSTLGPWMYVWAENDYLKAYHFNGKTFDTSTVSQNTFLTPSGNSGGVLTLSANGSTTGTGIVWSSMPFNQDGDHGTVTGVLRAFNADDLRTELWDSQMNSARDGVGLWPKFSPPTVSNGRVYMATFSNAVNVYGLLSAPPTDFTITTNATTVGTPPGSGTSATVTLSAVNGFAGTVNLTVSGLPTGATASFVSSSLSVPGSTTLNVTTSPTTPMGRYPLTITGASGTLSHTTTLYLVVSTVTPGLGVISIDLVGGGIAMGSGETAGVVPRSFWNEAIGASNGTAPLTLIDETGTTTSATATWSDALGTIWQLPIVDAPGNTRMMIGYLNGKGGNATVSVTGLPANSLGYDVYVYADGDNGSATRTATYQISGSGFTTTSANVTDAAGVNFSGKFVQANNSNGNYVVFAIQGTDFVLTAIPGTASDGNPRAPINGLQIVPKSPDFTLTASTPTSVVVAAGGSAKYTLNTTSLNGFSGSVALSVSGLPSGTTGTFASSSIPAPGSTTLNVTTATTTPLGSYPLTITGTSGSLSHSTSVTLTVSAAAPGQGVISIDLVGSGTAMATSETAGVVPKSFWNQANGATNGTTALSLVDETGANSGATATWSDALGTVWKLPVVDAPGNTRMMIGYLNGKGGNATVAVTGLPANPNGYDVYIYTDGDNGTATRAATYQMSGSGFTTSSVTVTDAAGVNFSGTFVQASSSSGNGNYVVFTILGTDFTLTAIPGAASDNNPRAPVNGLQIVPRSSPPVADFTLSAAAPTSKTVVPGGSASYSLSTTAINGFSGSVALSVSGLPSGATGTFTPSSVSVPGSATLNVTTATTTPLGSYPLTVTGTSGTLSHSTGVTLVVSSVAPGQGVISIDLVGTGTAMASSETAGVVPKSFWNQASGASNGTTPLALVDETGSATTATATWSDPLATVWKLPITDAPGNTRMMIGYLNGKSGNATVAVTGLPANSNGYDVYIYTDGDNGTATRTATYQMSGSGSTTTSVTVTDAPGVNFSGTFVQASNSRGNGNYVVFTILGTDFTLTAIPGAASDNNPRAPVNGLQIVPRSSPPVPDFILSAAAPTARDVVAGGSASYTFNTTAINGFSGSVALTVSGVPTGATATFASSSISAPGSTTLSVTTATTTPLGTYPLTITGTSGTLSHSVSVTLAVSAPIAPGGIQILSRSFDNHRTGANLSETRLNTSNVNVNQFGKLWSYSVSGQVYAQPLYVPNVTIPGKGTFNVLYVVTMNDVVYAFDADHNVMLWSVDLTNPAAGITPVPIVDMFGSNTGNIVGNVGVESTPAIDPATSTMFLLARTKENGSYFQKLHALDITTGVEKFGQPTTIAASVNKTGGGVLSFDPKIQNQRASLAIAGGQVFIAWASHSDRLAYHGWVMSYDTQTLQQTGAFSTSPDGAMGGIWMAGSAPVVDDAGNVYYEVGNGDWNGTSNFGESFLKFSSSNQTMNLVDWFTPDNWQYLNTYDLDLGSTGPMLIPGTNLLVGGGKQSKFYLLNTGSLGHEVTGNTQIPQILVNSGSEIKTGPVYWNRQGGVGPWMYIWAEGDVVKAYHFNATTFDTGVASHGSIPAPSGNAGGVLTLSANGSTPGSGIVWATIATENADGGTHPGVMRAFNADNLGVELWDSTQNSTRDNLGVWGKYNPPTVVNGKVYVGTFSNQVLVYGLLVDAPPDFTLTPAAPTKVGVAPGNSATFNVDVAAVAGFTGNVSLTVSGLPSGATGSFSSPTVAVPARSTLNVSTSAGTPLGTYPLTITGTSGSLVHTAAVTMVVTTVALGQGVISIDLVGTGNAMFDTEVAGVVPRSGWNQATGANNGAAALPLVDETATNTGATATWSDALNTIWQLPITDAPGNTRMMIGYLNGKGGNAIVNVTGLPGNPNGYDVYVYTDGDNGNATRTATYQMSGSGFATMSFSVNDVPGANFSGTFVQANNSAGNYVVFKIQGTGFTLTGIPGTATDNNPRAPINGLQIVPRTTP